MIVMQCRDLQHWLSLALLPQCGPARLKALYQVFGTPSEILVRDQACLAAAGLTPGFIDDLRPFLTDNLPDNIKRQREECLKWADQQDHCILTFGNEHYPTLLY